MIHEAPTMTPSHTCSPFLKSAAIHGQSPCIANAEVLGELDVTEEATAPGRRPHDRSEHEMRTT